MRKITSHGGMFVHLQHDETLERNKDPQITQITQIVRGADEASDEWNTRTLQHNETLEKNKDPQITQITQIIREADETFPV